MCRVGTIAMAAPGCYHARQAGWRDDAVAASLAHLIQPCSAARRERNEQQASSSSSSSSSFCSPLTIDAAASSSSSSPAEGGELQGPCEFCSRHAPAIALAGCLQQTLREYNMALLDPPTRAAAEAAMLAAFQGAVDEAAAAFGGCGAHAPKSRRSGSSSSSGGGGGGGGSKLPADGGGKRSREDRALRVLDAGYARAAAEVGRLCAVKQMEPYRAWYGAG